MKTELIIRSEEETCELAKIISEYCFGGFLITLNGELGAGKTRFSKALGEYLGITQNITSPTFNILKCYFEGKLPLYHIDAYRLEGMKQDLGFEEYIEGDGVCLIEWSTFIDYLLPDEYLSIEIYIVDENQRKFVIEPKGERYEKIVKEIVRLWK
jgi:tRNA threonylcarbamoyladenosine biosynthesis protein TsaE